MNFKKSLLLVVFACMVVSDIAAQMTPKSAFATLFSYFQPLSEQEREKRNKDAEEIKKKKVAYANKLHEKQWEKEVELEVERKSEFFLPTSWEPGFVGTVSRNFERHLIWSLGFTVFEGFKDLLVRGILDEGLRRFKRKVQRFCLTSALVKDTTIEDDLFLDDLILSDEIQELAKSIIGTFKNTETSGGTISTFFGGKHKAGRVRFNGYLFYGLPGTGKTELAKTIASEIARDSEYGDAKDIRYYLISGHKLACASLEEIEDFIGMLETSNALTIVVIDECETFLADTDGGRKKERSKGVNAWVEYTGKPSTHVQYFYMTNFEKQIDKRMRRRMQFIEFKYPDLQGRMKLLERYLDKEFLQDEEFGPQERAQIVQFFNNDTIQNIAQMLCIPQADPEIYQSGNVFAPANIENIMVEMKSRSVGLGHNGVPTASIMNAVLTQAIERKRDELALEPIK